MVKITGTVDMDGQPFTIDATLTAVEEGETEEETEEETMAAGTALYVNDYDDLKAMDTSTLTHGQSVEVTTTDRYGEFTVMVGDYSVEVAGDPQQGIYVPFDSDPTGASLVAWRKHAREINLDWFGAKGDYDGDPNTATDNWLAMMGALNILGEKPAESSFFIKPSKKLILNDGNYYFSKTVPVRRAVYIDGAGAGLLHFRTSNCFFPPDKHGFLLLGQDIDWDDDTETLFIPASDRDGSAQGATLKGLTIKCTDPQSATRGVGDGIHLTTTPILLDLHISGFGGDGIGGFTNFNNNDPDRRGDINNFYMHNIVSQFNENGISLRGSNSNAGLGTRIDVRHNRKWGILDWSFLGNTWVAPHENGCGRAMDITAMANDGDDLLVTANTDHELVVGDEVTLSDYEGARNIEYGMFTVSEVVSATQFKVAGENVASWTPYVNGGKVGYGGPYATRNINAHSIFIGAYAEGGKGPCLFTDSTIIYGGLIFTNVIGGFFHEPGGAFQDPISVSEPQSDLHVILGKTRDNSVLRMIGPGQSNHGTQLKWFAQGQDGGSWHFIDGNGNRRMLGFTTDASGLDFGRASPVNGVAFARELFIGGNNNHARCVTNGDEAPTWGEWGRGDVIYNREPSLGGYVGWVCTVGGVAGVDAVFRPFGKIE